jgi:hypothetical protein
MDVIGFEKAKYITVDGSKVYDLMEDSFVGETRIPYYTFYVTDEHEMRLDLISLDMYGSTKYMELIMDINGIINPFAIKKGDILVSTEVNVLDGLIPQQTLYDEFKQKMIDVRKKHREDPARSEFNRRSQEIERKKLDIVPTMQPKDKPLVELDGDYIKINPAF